MRLLAAAFALVVTPLGALAHPLFAVLLLALMLCALGVLDQRPAGVKMPR